MENTKEIHIELMIENKIYYISIHSNGFFELYNNEGKYIYEGNGEIIENNRKKVD